MYMYFVYFCLKNDINTDFIFANSAYMEYSVFSLAVELKQNVVSTTPSFIHELNLEDKTMIQ